MRAARRAADRAAAAAHEARLAHLGHRSGGVADGLSAALGRRADASGPALAAAEARRAAEGSTPSFCMHIAMRLTGAVSPRPVGAVTQDAAAHGDTCSLARWSLSCIRLFVGRHVQAAAAEARSALAALLVAADGRRRCEFLEAVVAGVHAAALFFERGHEARTSCLRCSLPRPP